MQPPFSRTVLSSLLIAVWLFAPLGIAVAEDGAAEMQSEVVPEAVSEADVEEEESSDNVETESPLPTDVPRDVEDANATSTTNESSTNVADNTGSTTKESISTTSSDTGTLRPLPESLVTESSLELLGLTEVMVVYELDKPIVIPLDPLRAVVVDEAKKKPDTFIGRVTDSVSDWFFGNTVSPKLDIPIFLDVNDTATTTPEEDIIDVSVPDVSVPDDEVDTLKLQVWWRIFSVAFAADEDVTTAEVPVTTEQASSTGVVVVTDIASTTEEMVTITATTSSNDVNMMPSQIVSSTTPLVRVGSSSLPQATLEPSEGGGYQIVIPPGALSIGIHELIIATTTAVGEINERVVVDIGGGKVRLYEIAPSERLVVVVDEEGNESLWLEMRADTSYVYQNIATPEVFKAGSPLTVFDETLFYIDSETTAIRAFSLVSRVTTSFSIEQDRAVVVSLPTGDYYIDVTPIDFQFVPYVSAVY